MIMRVFSAELFEEVHPSEFVSDNETLGVRDLPSQFTVPGLGNGLPFFPTNVAFDGARVAYLQNFGSVTITLYRM
jgi:hypothetical protein